MTTRRIAEMTWQEYAAAVKQSPVLFLPIGALEQHGPHMSMNTDVVIPVALAESCAERVNGLVAPALVYGYKSQPRSGGGNHFPGTTSLDGETLIRTVRDLLREFGRHGIRKFVIVDAHYENSLFIVEGIDLALRELRTSGIDNMKILKVAYYEFTSEETIRKVWPDGFAGWALEHAGVMETSVMLHLSPGSVDMSKAPDHPAAHFGPYDVFPLNAAVPSSGVLSSPRMATAEKGNLMYDEWVEGVSRAVLAEFPAGTQQGH
jgi:creatinine amidohydrolase